MRRRSILAALAVMAGGTLAAAAPASAASPFSCIGDGRRRGQHRPGRGGQRRLHRRLPRGRRRPQVHDLAHVQYKLSNAYLKAPRPAGHARQRREPARRHDVLGPDRGRATRSRAASTCAPSSTRPRTRAWSGTPRPRRSPSSATPAQRRAHRPADAGPRRHRHAVGRRRPSGRRRAPRRSSSRSPTPARSAWSRSRDQWRRATDTAPAPTDTLFGGGAPDVDPLTTARPYGNLYWRLRLGPNGRTSLDCVTGIVAIQDSTIAYKELGNYPAAPTAATRGRYAILAAARAALRVGHAAGHAEVVLVHRRPRQLRRPRAQRVRHQADRRRRPARYTPGQPYTLNGVKFDVTLPA